MVRDEDLFIIEWVEYHLMMGISHIHVYLHMSADNTAALLDPYTRAGLVTLRSWDFNWSSMWMRFQSHAFNDCSLRRGASGNPVWLSILDVDEFLVPGYLNTSSRESSTLEEMVMSIPQALSQIVLDIGGENVNAVKLGWLMYTSKTGEVSEHISEDQEPSHLTIDKFKWHRRELMPRHENLVGDQMNGKVLIRADMDVHVDFPGHKATIVPGGMFAGFPHVLHIAHYVGRARSYASSDSKQEAVASKRRTAIEEENPVRWKDNPLCFLSGRLEKHVCNRARSGDGFAGATNLCHSLQHFRSGRPKADGALLDVESCLNSGQDGLF